MKKSILRFRILLIIIITVSFTFGCSDKAGSSHASKGAKRKSTLQILVPKASGTIVYGNDTVSIDASNTGEGYVMLQYKGKADKAKLQITIPDSTVYTYTLTTGSYETFPLTGGNGHYHMDVLEHAQDDLYALAFSRNIDVTIKDKFKPFLYPNQYVWFTADSRAVKLGQEISGKSSDDLDYVAKVYDYVIHHIKYDDKKAEDTPTDYIPNLDETLKTDKGICFDYASLMAAMLRSQSIPTKLEVGYSGEVYHAWVSVYMKEKGWIDNIIEFDGRSWSLMDPTLGANNSAKAVGKYISDGSNYIVKYSY